MSTLPLREDEKAIAEMSRTHLESVLRVDSQSDEASESIPSTEGQRVLADQVAEFFASCGASLARDAHANVIASLPGRGAGASKPPIALMVHLDTSKGTETIDVMNVAKAWDGSRIPYPDNPRLDVSVETYPATREYLGHDVLFGHGRAPVGLDDKLGLAHIMTLAKLLHSNTDVPHPPIVFVGRPDEEIGRHAAVEGLAELFAERGVACGYTVDGILPYEVNVENFNASQSSVEIPAHRLDGAPAGGQIVHLFVGGVTTHGCTAKEEGHRNALRLVGEMIASLEKDGLVPGQIVPVSFVTSELREANAEVAFLVADDDARERLLAELGRAVDPHVPRGASWKILGYEPASGEFGGEALAVLRFVNRFLASDPGFTLLAEDSADFDGYSNPYRAVPRDGGGLRLDVRIRDFTEEGLEARQQHVAEQAEAAGYGAAATHQYVNMGPRMAEHEHLVRWPAEAGRRVDCEVRQRPIRGGTGVDPFLDKKVPIANLGTGYFALESEKEFTSMDFLAGHARWLVALMMVIAEE